MGTGCGTTGVRGLRAYLSPGQGARKALSSTPRRTRPYGTFLGTSGDLVIGVSLHNTRLPGDETAWPGRRSLCWCYANATGGTFFLRRFQGAQYLVGRDGGFIDTHAHGIIDGVGDGRNDGVERPLARLLGAERPFAVGNLYQDGFDFRRIQRRGELIVQQGGDFVP